MPSFPPDRDWGKAHPLLRPRYEKLNKALLEGHGIALWVGEIFRSDERQQWLYAQGRTAADCLAKGIRPEWARPGPVVTNAWSARTSAHGHTSNGNPSACAIDVVPLGADGRPWTKDDDWDKFVQLTTDGGSVGFDCGLVHFHRPGVAVWDKPHLQLVEWFDSIHDLRFAKG